MSGDVHGEGEARPLQLPETTVLVRALDVATQGSHKASDAPKRGAAVDDGRLPPCRTHRREQVWILNGGRHLIGEPVAAVAEAVDVPRLCSATVAHGGGRP